MKYAIGLDIGIASVGYAVLALDHEENPWGIIRLGSRIFDVAENPKDGASLALPRREARSVRRRLRRHHHRLERIKNLLINTELITKDELLHLYDGNLSDVYELRVKALDYSVTNAELTRILLHLAQRRGFKSNRKSDANDKEAGQLLEAVSANTKRMQENHYRTVGEMFYKDDLFSKYKRNKGGIYLTTVHRDMIASEARTILEKQFALGNDICTQDFIDKYLSILLSQRQFDEGPGEPSPYAGNQIANIIGKCTFEPNEHRAAKASYSFERFNLLQKVNHLRLLLEGKSIALDNEQRKKIIALAHEKADLRYSHIRKALGLDEKVLFNTITYNEDVTVIEKKTKFNFLPAYHQIKKALAEDMQKLTTEQLDNIGQILSTYKSDNKRTEELSALGLEKKIIDALLGINGLSKFAHLSLKALRKINPYLEEGKIYNEACAAAGYDFKGHANTQKTELLPAYKEEMDDITSPVARRAIAQSIKVINAIIREQKCSPVYINIELAREMAKGFDERTQIDKANKENQAKNERIMERIRTEFHKSNPSGMDLIKLKLWEEQDGRSPYSQKAISINRLFEPGYVDIDHIVPYSISFDDSFKNKVLVFSDENRDKSNRLPIAYLQSKFGAKAAENFMIWAQSNIKDYKKRQKLLKREITEEDINKFKERNLQDTKTISRFLYNYINDYLLFAPSDTGKKKRVTAVNGTITAYLRKRWGINKIRANGDKHHAVDAVVIACTTDKMIKDLSAFSQYHELEYTHTEKESLLVNSLTGEILKHFPYPWEDFRPELMARLSNNPAEALRKLNLLFYHGTDLSTIKPIFVSRMPRHKVTGAAHKATIKSARCLNNGIVICKTRLENLKLNKEGEISNYYAPESDTILYNALKERLRAYDNKPAKAFAEPFYKPKADGTPGPLVKKVKVYEKSTLNVAVQQNTAVADNDSMVRVDVFHVKGGGYYLVPIYIADTLKKELPNKAIVASKPYADWPAMDDSNFVFSLYPNDLIKFEHRSEKVFNKVNKDSNLSDTFESKVQYAYFKSADISTASIRIITHDNTYFIKSLGVKTLSKLEKYQVDILGNYTKVKKEIRKSFR
ncbi:type II CRISPR RNA-guided endonuclease Cas9 [Phascolarctobacterium succinatutens]|uniref:type II CRISPR RNA-guided endonuclease Cas9 n=1 Tax=Phascolarctobacterium succinatutens TaxID=626940 RepID=UPI0026ED316C|nr:type II CRISPR RNA-guided endonuclease Cas9 [Phascolarctobacterium succinatutens]